MSSQAKLLIAIATLSAAISLVLLLAVLGGFKEAMNWFYSLSLTERRLLQTFLYVLTPVFLAIGGWRRWRHISKSSDKSLAQAGDRRCAQGSGTS